MHRNIAMMTGLLLAMSPSAFTQQNSVADRPTKQAKISRADAEKIALAKEPGKIKEGELEQEHHRLIYSFDIETSSGVHEVNVDATTGEVVEDSVETTADEEKEKKDAPQ
jgi:uncharacterized membrane protein YkoI